MPPLFAGLALSGLVWGCSGLHADFYDHADKLTRVQYVPGAAATSVATNFDKQEDASARRLSDGPVRDAPDTVTITANPDDLYIMKNDTATVIYGTDVHLQEFMWSPALDLVVKGATVTIPSEMKFWSIAHRAGRGCRVHIHAMKLIIPETGALLDVSGEAGRPLPAAADGFDYGDAGRDGHAGERGSDGGHVLIKVGTMEGGDLTVHAYGGKGGPGQDGGSGRRGVTGDAPDDAQTACCAINNLGNKDRLAKVTTGKQGGPGGAAGDGGKGGNGGAPGTVTVLIGDESMVGKVHADSKVGAGGEPGKAGSPGAAGHGGPGGPTKCRKVDMLATDWRCFPPLGSSGLNGTAGQAASDGVAGQSGSDVPSPPVIKSETLEQMRAGECGQHLQFEQLLADRSYAMADYEKASSVYKWIEAVGAKTPKECLSGEPTPWRQITMDASLRRANLALGLDFWGHRQDYAPLLTFEALYDKAVALLLMAAETERAYDVYLNESTANNEKISLIKKAMHNLDYEMSQVESEFHTLSDDIRTVLGEIDAVDIELARIAKVMTTWGAECEAAALEKAAREEYGFKATIKHLIEFVKSTRIIALNFMAQSSALYVAAHLIWNTGFSNLVPHGERLVTVAQGGDPMSMVRTAEASALGSRSVVQTFISDVRRIQTDGQNLIADIRPTLKQLQTNWDGQESAVLTRMQAVTSRSTFDDIITQWIGDLPECQAVKEQLPEYVAVAANLHSKVAQHDSLVLQLAEAQMRHSKLHAERVNLDVNSAGTFTPTGLSNMLAISQAYRSQKDGIITTYKAMREAMNYEFCDDVGFLYTDVRVVQLAAFLADIVAERSRKRSAQLSERAVAANIDEATGQRRASTVIKLSEAGGPLLPMAFESYRETGTFLYALSQENSELPVGVANLRVVSAQAFVPALLKSQGGKGDIAQVWMKKVGASTCADVHGNTRSFSHASMGFYSMYSTLEDANTLAPNWLTDSDRPEDTVNPSPIGLWEISMPNLDQQGRDRVDEIQLHFVLSYESCTEPNCGSRVGRTQYTGWAAQGIPPSVFPTIASTGTVFVVLGTAAAISMLLLAVAASSRGRRQLRSSLAEGLEEQAETNVHACEGRRAPLVSSGECQ